MSLNSAMLAGVSGLAANSAALAAISQNIANVNTVGYKRTQGEFQTLVNSQSKAGGGYSAGGVAVAARSFISQEGQLQRLGSDREHRVDVRLIAATNRDLADQVRQKAMRADFYHRLSVYPLHVPALRERGRDVLTVAGFFLDAQQIAYTVEPPGEPLPTPDVAALAKDFSALVVCRPQR